MRFLSLILLNYTISVTFDVLENTCRILVTGGAGFIGSHTVVSLIEQGYSPIIVDDFRNSDVRAVRGIEKITGQKVELHKVDVTDIVALRAIFESYNFDGIIHFAAYKAVGESVANPLMYYQNNLVSLMNCIELCEEFKVNNFVFSSSCTVYGEPDDVVVKESTPVKPANAPYGQTKQICEQMLKDVHASGSDLKVLCLRYFNPIGAHPSGAIGELPLGIPNNLVPFVTQTAIGKLDQLTVFGDDYNTADGSCIRDYIHVMDLADAHLNGLEWLSKQDASEYKVVNVGTGKGASVLEIIHTFESVTGAKLNWSIGPRREGDVSQIYADPTRASELLHWKAKRSLEDSLKDAWNWEQKLANEK
ncbi:MAG: UDP-glucose 4-epimerase GalE [Crocinitomicaceae bacterium]